MPAAQKSRAELIYKEYIVSIIQCPYCQSGNVKQTASGNSNYFEQLQSCISPAQMALLGAKLAKKAGFSPAAGAAVGVVIGGVLVVVSQYYFEKYYSQADQYLCLDCRQHFAWVKP
jgi:DNA-directed RNA polymerase subunit RPC12/RpoP